MLDNQEVFAYALFMSRYRAAGICSICLVKARQLSVLLDMAKSNRFIKLSCVACFKYFIYLQHTSAQSRLILFGLLLWSYSRFNDHCFFILPLQIDNMLIMAELF